MAGRLGPQHGVALPEIGRFTELCAGGSLCSGDDEGWAGKRCHRRSRCEQCFSEVNAAMAKEIRAPVSRCLQHGTCPLESLMIHMTSVRIQWGGLQLSRLAVVTVWRIVP